MLEIYVPSGSSIGTTRMKVASCPAAGWPTPVEGVQYGRICVVGLATGSHNIAAASARVYYGTDPGAPPSTPPEGSQPGKVLITAQKWPPGDPLGVYYNFRFIVEPDADNTVCKAGDGVGGDGDDDNWLVIWIEYADETWDVLKLRIKCLALPFTDCECGKWYDTFTDQDDEEVIEHHGELTPGDPPYSGSSAWKIIDDAATGLAPANQNAEIVFDPGALAFTATHRVRFPGPPETDTWTVWALRSVRYQSAQNRWQWQIGRTNEEFFFHELTEWNNGTTTHWDSETLADPPSTGFVECRMSVDEESISVTYGTESTLSAESDAFADEPGQAFATYYDVGEAEPPAVKTAFDTLQVLGDCPQPQQSSFLASRAGFEGAEAPEEAVVLCELVSGPGPGGPVWRACGFWPGVPGVKWRWTDLAQRQPGLGLSIYRVRGRSLKRHLARVQKDSRCCVLWHEAGVSKRTATLSEPARERVGLLLARHGIQGIDTTATWEAGGLADALVAKLREINARLRSRQRLSTHPASLARYEREIANRERELATASEDVRPLLERRIAGLVLRREMVRARLHEALRLRNA